jgi:ribosomal protein S27AE
VLARQCPLCGRGAVFPTHFHMNRTCPRCHVVFWKDPGESLGAMYLDYAVATVAFLVGWAVLALTTRVSDNTQIAILCVLGVGSVIVCYPWTRSAWTVLVYLSGGIERPRMRAIRGVKPPSAGAA